MQGLLSKYHYLKEWILAIALVSSTVSSLFSSVSAVVPLLLALLYAPRPQLWSSTQTGIVCCIAALFIPGALWYGDMALLGFGLSSLSIFFGVFLLHSRLSMDAFFRALLYTSGTLCAVLLIYAALRAVQAENIDLLLYHSLSFPLWANAIYLSVFLSGVLYFSLFQRVYSSRIEYVFLGIIMLTILLLQSRMFIVLNITMLGYAYFSGRIFSKFSRNSLLLFFSATVIIAGATLLPRVMEIADQETFKYDTQTVISEDVEYNGLELRILFLGFTKNIMIKSSMNQWLFGRGRTQTTEQLNTSIVSKGMYTGLDCTAGFLNYNTHNQFAQTLLHQGIWGILCMLFAFYFVASSSQYFHSSLLLGLLFAFLTEVYLERHLGVVVLSYWLSFSALLKPNNA